MFVSHILTRKDRVEEDLVDQLFNSTEKRLARLLLLLANFGKEGRPEPIMAKISQEVLAEMIGTTRSRVSRWKGVSLNCRRSSDSQEVRKIGNDSATPYANPPYANLDTPSLVRTAACDRAPGEIA